ncbi:hypothetical protein COR50_19700 [Chitinophaga caeni]|uniref:Uncharacterized protein n=1 Tax=Chitinophaga caeni TaxID=2029983 RepID=A0A291QYW9_9BACT|nr:hypothetical protein [Chitinophaga caeni]ATL49219.1 hypothetical protein COR50_19700 [Chitinophaga caeni]
MKKLLLTCCGLALFTGLLSSCGPSKPERKKLPMYSEAATWEGPYGYRGIQATEPGNASTAAYFTYADTLVAGQRYAHLNMFNPELDSLALAAAKFYQPMATAAVQLLKQQGISGVVADFRMPNSLGFKQSSFLATDLMGQTAPVIFLWNDASAARAAVFMQTLNTTQGLKVNQSNN